MAIPIRNIPVLSENAAEEFLEKIEIQKKKVDPREVEESLRSLRAILKKSKIN